MFIAWVMDGSELLSEDKYFSNASLPPGHHRISLLVWDAYYEFNASVNVSIIAQPTGGEQPTGAGDDGSSFFRTVRPSMLWSAGAVVLVIVALTIFYYRAKLRRPE